MDIAVKEKTIIVDELVNDDGVYGIYELANIRKSPDNRKRFDPVKLQELADSIKSMGVAQPILIRPVTPTAEQPEEYEIVAGERRYRGSIIAGRAGIPAMCRHLSDIDAAKIRILENLQREDPHPIEEAEGYQLLMMQHGYTADQLVEEIKKSRAYVYGRLKLCALTLAVRDQVLDGKIDASTALLVARIPVPTLQARVMAEILEGYHDHPMSYREAAKHVQENYMLDLKKAEFDPADAKLLAKAGACSNCPKRAGNQPEVFVDISADVCTDPDCFTEKKAAQVDKVIGIAKKKGIPTFDDYDALATHDPERLLVRGDEQLFRMQRIVASSDSWKPVVSKLSIANTPPVKAYLHANGRLIPVFEKSAMQTALEEVGACSKAARLIEKAGESNITAPNAARLAKMKAETEAIQKKEQIARRETDFRISLYKQFRERAANGLSLQSLRDFVKLVLIDDNSYALPSDVLDVYGDLASDSDKDVAAYIDQATLPEVQLILIDLVLGNCLGVEAHQVAADGTIDDDDYCNGLERIATLHEMAAHAGIDLAAAREQFDLAALAIEEVDERYMHRFLRAYPERINELTKSIVDSRLHLIGALELAAKDCGFVYIGNNTWSTHSPGVTDTTGANDAAPQPLGDADIVACEGQSMEAAIAEPAPAKQRPPKAAKSSDKGKVTPEPANAVAAPSVKLKDPKRVPSPSPAWPWPTK